MGSKGQESSVQGQRSADAHLGLVLLPKAPGAGFGRRAQVLPPEPLRLTPRTRPPAGRRREPSRRPHLQDGPVQPQQHLPGLLACAGQVVRQRAAEEQVAEAPAADHTGSARRPLPAPRLARTGPRSSVGARACPCPRPRPHPAPQGLTPDLPPHGVNPQLLRPHPAPGPAQVLPAPLVGSALGVPRLRRAAPLLRGRVRALRLPQAVLGQAAADSPAFGRSSALGRHGAGSAGPNARRARPVRAGSAALGPASGPPALRWSYSGLSGFVRLFAAKLGSLRDPGPEPVLRAKSCPSPLYPAPARSLSGRGLSKDRKRRRQSGSS